MKWNHAEELPKDLEIIMVRTRADIECPLLSRYFVSYGSFISHGNYYPWSEVVYWCPLKDFLDQRDWKSSYQSMCRLNSKWVRANKHLRKQLKDVTEKLHWYKVQLQRIEAERTKYRMAVDPATRKLLDES